MSLPVHRQIGVSFATPVHTHPLDYTLAGRSLSKAWSASHCQAKGFYFVIASGHCDDHVPLKHGEVMEKATDLQAADQTLLVTDCAHHFPRMIRLDYVDWIVFSSSFYPSFYSSFCSFSFCVFFLPLHHFRKTRKVTEIDYLQTKHLTVISSVCLTFASLIHHISYT